MFDRELTGLYLDDYDWGGKRDYWHAVYHHLTITRLPAQGVLRGPRLNKEHLVHFWLRLPLSHAGNPAAMILGHDILVPAQDVPATVGLDPSQLASARRRCRRHELTGPLGPARWGVQTSKPCASALMRDIIATNPLERCGDRCL